MTFLPLTKLLALTLIASPLFLSTTAQAQSDQILSCASSDYDKSYCRAKGEIRSVRLRRQLSNSDCDHGDDWGYNRNSVWVDNGCRADFTVSLGHYRDNDYDDDGDTLLAIGGLALLLSALDDDLPESNSYYRGNKDKVVRACVDYGYNSARKEGARSVRIINPQYARFERFGSRSHLQAKFEASFPQGRRIVNIRCDVENGRVLYFHYWED